MNMKNKIIIAFAAVVAFVCAGAFAQNVSYKVGDTGPGGGIVFYYSEVGFSVQGSDVLCHYLECSPTELGLIPWCPRMSERCSHYFRDGALKYGIGDGKGNTETILRENHTVPLTSANCAAKACAEYSTKTTKAGEWYLPSANELELIYRNLKMRGKITSDSWHWSSSADELNYRGRADAVNFSNGNKSHDLAYYTNVVRAVRAF